MSSQTPKAIPFERGGVRGFLHEGGGADALALTHGAGGDCNAALLVAVAEAFQAAGVSVLRFDLPFRQRRPKGPPGASDAASDRAGVRSAIEALRSARPGEVFLGGLSYGGRQATLLAAEAPELAEALLLLSYPLHPPGKPDQPRTAHFPKLSARCVFVHGTADPFGSILEMTAAIRIISAAHELIIVEGAGHDLKRGRFDMAAMVEYLTLG